VVPGRQGAMEVSLCRSPSLPPSSYLSSRFPTLFLHPPGLLFVDSPVGTGYSEAGAPDAYSQSVRGRERGRKGGREGGREGRGRGKARFLTVDLHPSRPYTGG